MENVTVTIILDSRKAKSNGKFPLKLRVTYQRKQKYYPIYEDLTQEEYENVFSIRPKKEFRDLRDKLDSLKLKANEIINKSPDFTFQAFETKLLKPSINELNVFDLYSEYVSKLRREGRISTAITYECSMKSLYNFSTKLSLHDISVDFLYKYEAYMIGKGNTYTTISMYIRTLRVLYNMSIEKGIISQTNYPFGKRKYEIPVSQNIKKALPLSDILRIKNYKSDIDNTVEERYRDFWLFSYLSNGINFKDIAKLKFKNIKGDTLIFERAKTRHSTRSNPKLVKVHLLPQLLEIINKHGNNFKDPENYIFPIIKSGMTALEEYKTIQQFIKSTNKYMKRIASNLKIELPITTYYARHSYATVLRNSGASVEYISESLGHSSLKTTANYLDSFEDKKRKEIASLLLPE